MKILTISLISFLYTAGLIESGSIDGIKIGMSINEFLNIRKEQYIVKKEKIQLEGDEYDIYNVYQNGKKVYAIEPDCEKECKIWRIWVYGRDFKTKEGIGVGSTLSDLKGKYTIKELSIEGEGGVAIFVKEIDVTFFLDSTKIPETWWTNQNISSLNDQLVIDMIIIT
jgi:hypothetical protein